mmetsp:Transcript_2955/g.10644  ORF Transcript_2955/g.10644 Transcript_2955/m.10644 type:complete len:247 (+) Transcript_2955:695-1435(+)
MCSRVSKSLKRRRFGHTNMRRAHKKHNTHGRPRAAEPRQSRRVRAVPCPRPLSGARDGSHWMCGHTEGRSAPSVSRARQLGAATTGTVRLRPSESMPAVMTSPGPTGPTPSGVPVSSRSPSSSVCTRETASSSAGTPKIIRPVEPLCRGAASPFTRSHMSSEEGSATAAAGTISLTGQDVSQPLAAAHGLPAFFAASCAPRSVMSSARQYPPTCAIASAAFTRVARRPMTTPSSSSWCVSVAPGAS